MGTPWRAIHLAVACMIGQSALALVLGTMVLGKGITGPIAFTGVLSGLAFLFAYYTTEPSLTNTRPPWTVESLPEIIRGLETSMGVTVRKTYIVDDDVPRAEVRPLILHASVDLYLTSAIFEDLDVDEIAAVIAHELAHVTYHDHHYRTFSAIVELFSMTTAATIIFWTIYTGMPGILRESSRTPVTEVQTSILLSALVAGVLWISGRAIAGSYRRTSEFVADQRAGEFASFESMYTALVALDPDQIVGPSTDVIERLTDDYPVMMDRLTQLYLAKTNRD